MLDKIKRRAPEAPKPTPAPAAAPHPAKSKRGAGVQFWFHDEDRRQIRELYAWLAGQGLRPSDSAIIRAALRMAKPGAELLEAYREAAGIDGRLGRNEEVAAS